MRETTDAGPYPIRAVDRVCDILEVLQQTPGGASLVDVAELTGLPKSSAYRYLLALEGRRYVEREAATGMYRLGLAFLPQQTRQLEVFAERARPHLERLRDKLGETVNLGVLDGSRILHTQVVESPQMMRLAARVGDRGALHSTALGKAISANLAAERVLAMLAAEGMQRLTPTTITSAKRFMTELDAVRQRGYAIDDCENQSDGRCVAVAVVGVPFEMGVSVSAPASRLPRSGVPAVGRALRLVAAQLVREFQDRPA
jgi:IclR family transcriptional regulator, acetate operon repressor